MDAGLIDLGSIQLGYERAGAGPLVVCIGGMDMDFALWKRMKYLQTLHTAGYATLTLTLRGVAPSTIAPPPYTVDLLAEDCGRALQALQVEECSVLGISLGAFVAQELVLAQPGGKRALALVATALQPTLWSRLSTQAELRLYDIPGDAAIDYLVATDLLQTFSARELADDAFVKRVGSSMKKRDHFALGRRGLLSAVAAYEGCADRLRALQVPVLMVSFEHDMLMPAHLVEQACQTLPRAKFVKIAAAAHAGIFTQSADVAGELVAFFNVALGHSSSS